MIVPVAEERGVGDHNAGITERPERPVVGPADARHKQIGRHAADRRKGRVPAEGADHLVQEAARARQAHDGDEIGRRWENQSERNGICL